MKPQEIIDHLQRRWVDRVRNANWKAKDQEVFEAIEHAVWSAAGQNSPQPDAAEERNHARQRNR